MNSPNKSATEIVTDFLFLPFFQTPLIPNSRLWEFGVVCGWEKSLQQNIRVIRGICGFKANPQISTNFHKLFCGLNGLFLNNFT